MNTTKERSVFDTLNAINCNEHTEKKNGLTYLSWAWAWSSVKSHYPNASYTIYESSEGWNYFTDGRTCWVKTGVTIDGLEHIEYLPVMDYRNQSIQKDKVTSFDVNKAIQRSLTKACARHGLGLYIYAGEDLPEPGESAKPMPTEHSVKQNKGLIAWTSYKQKSTDTDDSSIKAGFAKLVLEMTGKASSKDVTDSEWDKVIGFIVAA